MKKYIHIAENASGVLLLPMKPGSPAVIIEAGNLPHFVGRPDWSPVTALPTAMTRTLAEWLKRWRLTDLRVSRDYSLHKEELIVDVRFSNGLRIAFADPADAITARIGDFECVFTSQSGEHATIRRNGEPRGALSIALGTSDLDIARLRFAGFPDPQQLGVDVADAWEETWGTRPRPSQVANIGGGTW